MYFVKGYLKLKYQISLFMKLKNNDYSENYRVRVGFQKESRICFTPRIEKTSARLNVSITNQRLNLLIMRYTVALLISSFSATRIVFLL